MEAVSAARQAVVLDPIDADDLVDLLEHAAVLVGYLAADPAAEPLNIDLTNGERSLRVLAVDLALAAADLIEATTPEHDP